MRLPFGHHASAAATRELDASSRQEREEAAAHAKTPKRTNRALASAPAAALESSGMRRCQSASLARRRAAPPVRKSRSHSQEPAGRYKPCRNHPRLQAAPNATPVAIPPSARARLSFEADGQDLARMYDHATWNMYERIVTARRHRLSQMDSQGSEPDTSASSSPVEAEGPSASQARPRSRAATTTAKPTKLNSSDGSSTLSTADESDRTSITSSWSRPESPGAFPSATALGLATARAANCPPLPVAEGEEDDPLVFELDM
ncbi:hypothetical protein ACHAXT_003465 [Thalassiosira profunda]